MKFAKYEKFIFKMTALMLVYCLIILISYHLITPMSFLQTNGFYMSLIYILGFTFTAFFMRFIFPVHPDFSLSLDSNNHMLAFLFGISFGVSLVIVAPEADGDINIVGHYSILIFMVALGGYFTYKASHSEQNLLFIMKELKVKREQEMKLNNELLKNKDNNKGDKQGDKS